MHSWWYTALWIKASTPWQILCSCKQWATWRNHTSNLLLQQWNHWLRCSCSRKQRRGGGCCQKHIIASFDWIPGALKCSKGDWNEITLSLCFFQLLKSTAMNSGIWSPKSCGKFRSIPLSFCLISPPSVSRSSQFIRVFTPLSSHVFSAVVLSPPSSSLSTRAHPFVVYSSALWSAEQQVKLPLQILFSFCLLLSPLPVFPSPSLHFFLLPTQFRPN